MAKSTWMTRGGLPAIAVLLCTSSQVKAQLPCVGDCDGNGVVAVNELITGVNINLGNREIDACPAFDSNDDGQVAINELIQGVNANLQGCVSDVPTPTATATGPTEVPATATATATATEAGATATATATATEAGPTATETATAEPTETATATEVPPTSTPNEVVEEVAGASAAVVNSLSSIANVVGAVVAGVSGGAGGAGAVASGLPGGGAGGDLDPCELGGTVFTNIEIVIPTANITVEFNSCRVSRPGGSVMFDGSLTVTGVTLQLVGNADFDAVITFMDDQQQVVAVTDADIQSPVQLTAPIGTGPCTIDLLGERNITGVDLTQMTGTLGSAVPDEGVAEVTFLDTVVNLDINQYGTDCVPTSFDLMFDGNAQIAQTAAGQSLSFDVEFDAFLLTVNQSGDQSLVTMSGDLIASCFGGTITLGTPQDLSFLLGSFCPESGVITVQDIGDVIYSQSGVEANGMLFSSCLDPALLTCAM